MARRLARTGGNVSLIRTVSIAVSVILLAFCGFAFWVVFERSYGTSGTIIAIIAQAGAFIQLAVVFGITLAAAASTRKPLRPSNYPRIEHLRIAGKYHAVGTSAEMGISPLHLRG
jgi:hypothetical protein